MKSIKTVQLTCTLLMHAPFLYTSYLFISFVHITVIQVVVF